MGSRLEVARGCVVSNAVEHFADRLTQRDPDCLHCWILAAVEAYAINAGDQIDAELHLDGNRIMAALAAVMANILKEAPSDKRLALLSSLQTQLRDQVETRRLN